MHIQSLTAHHVRIPLRKTIKHASHTRTENDTLLIRCQLSDGTIGWGEGLPRPYVTGGTIDTAFAQLQQTPLAERLSADVSDLPASISLLESFTLENVGTPERDGFGNSVRCALEVSLLDAVTRSLNRPFYSVIDELPDVGNIKRKEPADRVRYSGVITMSSPLKEMISAAKMRYYGFHQCKLKVGVEGVNDRRSLRRIRRVVGPSMDLRIDANESWTCENMEEQLAPLLPFNITSVEQPVPVEDVAGLSEVRQRINVPIMHDESLCTLGDAQRAIDEKTCDLFNIRLSKCGGLIPSLKIAALARSHGLGYQLGCQVGETGILSAAGRHFATVVDHIRYLEGSFDRFLVAESLTQEDLTFGRGGYAPRLDGPGLGITMDEDAIQRVTLKQEVFEIHG